MRRTTDGGTLGHARRGIAMMLVLIAMVVTVVLTSAVMMSRRSGPAIGANSAAAVGATWSAESAANYAVGVLAEGFDWRSAMDAGGGLVEQMTIGGATVDVTLTDLEGNVPDAEDRDLIMTAVATVDGISTTVRRMISLGSSVSPVEAIDPRLGEFGVFAAEALEVSHGATIAAWARSPEAGAHPTVKVGTGFASASDLQVDLAGNAGSVALFADDRAGAGVVSELRASDPSAWRIPYEIPVLRDAAPSMSGLPNFGSFTWSNNDVATAASGSYGDVRVDGNSRITLPDGVVVRCDSVRIENAMIRVEGEATVYVRAEMELRSGGRIVLATPESRLRLFLCESLEMEAGSQLGVVEADAGRGAAALSTWVSPDAVRISQGDAGHCVGGIVIDVESGATLLGSVQAPDAAVVVRGGGTMIGRATVGSMRVEGGSALWYCPTLDNRAGFTCVDGPLYAADGTPDPVAEAALDEVMSGGSVDTSSFVVLLESAYTELLDLLGLGGGGGGVVADTVNLFTEALGLY